MAEEPQGSTPALAVEPSATPAENPQTPVVEPQQQPVVSEPVDGQGVPIRNREAEAIRKARKADEAQSQLLHPVQPTVQPGSEPAAQPTQEEVLQAINTMVAQNIEQRLAPITARQFLAENPDATEMIEDINRIRQTHPEVGGINQLQLAYRLAKAERQEALLNTQAEQARINEANLQAKAQQAGVEGGGRANPQNPSIDESIKNATSIAELDKIMASLKTR